MPSDVSISVLLWKQTLRHGEVKYVLKVAWLIHKSVYTQCLTTGFVISILSTA